MFPLSLSVCKMGVPVLGNELHVWVFSLSGDDRAPSFKGNGLAW